MNHIRNQGQVVRLLLAIIIMLALVSFSQASIAQKQTRANDLLAYTIRHDGQIMLKLLDPTTQKHITLYEIDKAMAFKFSSDGRIALEVANDGVNDFFILDIHTPNEPPLDFRDIFPVPSYPIQWSHDGHYLALASQESAEGRSLYIWDGKTITDITPPDLPDIERYFHGEWSPDGRFAFTAYYEIELDYRTAEIYLWDGTSTIRLDQSSQTGGSSLAWGSDNQLAFLIYDNGKHDIFVWDGMSIKDGVPDADTFVNIAPDLTTYYSFPVWTSDGRVAFNSSDSDQHSHEQVYVWDGLTATNISQNPKSSNGRPRWSPDGYWAATAFYSSPLLYIRDADNKTILTAEGIQTPAWSADGNLIFCNADYSGVSMWDGHDVRQIISGWEIWAQGQSGEGIVCSSG